MKHMMTTNQPCWWRCCLQFVLAFTISAGSAVISKPVFAEDRSASAGTDDALAQRQASVAARFAKLEELLLRLADMEVRENPERAALLRRVARQSRERFVLEKLRGASTLISKGQLTGALDDQEAATDELRDLLKLLMSEDRSNRIRDEKKRIADLIKQLRLTERNERSVRARTENGIRMAEVQKEQQAIREKADALQDQMKTPEDRQNGDSAAEPKESSEAETEKAEGSPGEPKEASSKDPDSGSPPKADSGKSESKKPGSEKSDEPAEADENEEPAESDSSGDQKPGQSESEASGKPTEQSDSKQTQPESNSSESKPSESKPSESKPSESTPSQPTPSGQSQSSPAQPQQSGPQPSDPSQPQTPPSAEEIAQQQIQRAVEKMRQAEQKLAERQRDVATEKQREAEEELRRAIDELEKILRQLREEEIQRELAKLEARLRKMAAMQSSVLDDTVQLAQTPSTQRNRSTDLKASELGFEEQKITLEADRAMLLLREEGSSVAFPEVISQLIDDTGRVATRLGQTKIDGVTQGIQEDILAALEEMIDAVQQAQRDLEEKQQQKQQGQPGQQQQGEEPLVAAIAELKLIRTMQSRIQRSTDRYAGLLQEEASSTEEVLPLLRNLSQRQDRLYEITRDLVNKQNR